MDTGWQIIGQVSCSFLKQRMKSVDVCLHIGDGKILDETSTECLISVAADYCTVKVEARILRDTFCIFINNEKVRSLLKHLIDKKTAESWKLGRVHHSIGK